MKADFHSVKVLVVDDDETVHKVIESMLKPLGCRFDFARNGAAGLRKWKSFQPDLIILDVMMPQMDGYSFIQQSRLAEGLSPAPVIVLTSKEGLDELFEDEMVCSYLVKPVEKEDLVSKLRQFVRGAGGVKGEA